MLIGAQISQLLVNNLVTEQGTASLVQWRHFWIIPCVAAGLIMVGFGLLFRENGGAQQGSRRSKQAGGTA
jgi:hypothetical protein